MGQKRAIRIALAGNPNSGKTSVFNSMTGAHQKVGNWPGVTVEKKTGNVSHGGYDIEVVDLPGTYSLTAYSVEERVTRSFIADEKPDVVIHVIDSGNLARNLYLTVQLLELGVDVILDLNMWDEFENSGATLDRDKLGVLFGSPVVTTVGHRGEGTAALLDAVIRLVEEREEKHRHVPITYGPHVDDILTELVDALTEDDGALSEFPLRWAAIKLLEGDAEMLEALAREDTTGRISEIVRRGSRHIEVATGADAEKVISEGRHGYIEGALKESFTDAREDRMELSRQIDNIFTNRFLGYPIFLAFVWVLFQLTFKVGGFPMMWIESFIERMCATLCTLLPDSLLTDLLVDGIIGGVGSVIVFLPNIMILFMGIAFLEDSGYMARAAFLMDRLMHALGLHGKSFIPMLMGFGCSVPAVMATRTLESKRDRLLTMLVIPLMSCSARLPVYLLIAGTFFAERAGTMIFIVYLIGIAAALIVGRLFSRTIFRSAPAPFVMELPPYRLPTAKGLLIHTWERSRIYLQKMGGVILVASIILWFLGAFPRNELQTDYFESQVEGLRAIGTEVAETRADEIEREFESKQIRDSYIGTAGRAIAPVVKPLGFSWEMGVSLVTGFVAKEVVVSTLGVLYQSEIGGGDSDSSLTSALRDPSSGIAPLGAFAFMVFVLLYTPCIVTVAAIKREAGAGWMWFSIGYQLALAWLVSFAIYQIGTLAGFA